jgi:type I restriction enzyme S subunit
MTESRVYNLSEVCRVYQPETIAKKSLPANGTYPVYGANGKIGLNDKFNHEEPQLLLGCRGSVGSIHISEPFSWINGNAMVVKPFEDLVTRDYLKYALLGGINIRNAISGTAQPQITRESLSRIKISVPTLDKQCEIVENLDKAFGEIEAIRESITKRINGVSELFAEVCLEKTRELNPSGFQALKEIATVVTKGTTPTSLGYKFTASGVNFLKVESLDENGDFINSKFAYIDKVCHESLKRSQLAESDVLVSIAGALGRTAIVTSEICPANVNQALALIRLPKDSEISPKFLFALFQAGYFKNELDQMGAGAAQQNLSLAQIGSLKVPIFHDSKQIEFIEFLNNLRILVTDLKNQLDKQNLLKLELQKSILTTAFLNSTGSDLVA